MKLVIEVPDDYLDIIKGISDDMSTADMLLIKYGIPLGEYCVKCPCYPMERKDY